jgi:hypothetical protein
VGDVTADPDLWDFCGADQQEPETLERGTEAAHLSPDGHVRRVLPDGGDPQALTGRLSVSATESDRRPVGLVAEGAPKADYERLMGDKKHGAGGRGSIVPMSSHEDSLRG